ncbi:MAG: hypothetical protein ACJAUW_000153, partial [Yoonia sp.]
KVVPNFMCLFLTQSVLADSMIHGVRIDNFRAGI